MNQPADLDRSKCELALKKWQADCRQRMAQRYPTIPFDADRWPLRGVTVNDASDFNFTSALVDFANKHPSFAEALRCHLAEIVLGDKVRHLEISAKRFRLLRLAPADSLFDIDHAALRSIETTELERARRNPASAQNVLIMLSQLGRTLDTFADKGICPHLRYGMKPDTNSELLALQDSHRKKLRQPKAAALNRMIEALNEAFNALLANDARLSASDRVALAMIGLIMCAPSRINEILCLSIDDHVSVEDYTRHGPNKGADTVHSVHQMLLMTMKGSKGAKWSAKPVLNFMIDFFHYCLKVILKHGERSRMLVQWYQQHPDRLYLPPELEHLRGTNLTVRSLANIMALSEQSGNSTKMAQILMAKLGTKRFKVPHPKHIKKNGQSAKYAEIDAARWDDIEPLLLANVRRELKSCRAVTRANHYKGDLTKMLFLFDHDFAPYLPGSAKYKFLRVRLKHTASDKKVLDRQLTLFEKLKIMMPVNGVTQIAEINTHDPRRWLTTMALIHGEKLSNVLINKWANRLNVKQLGFYDFRSAETKAAASAIPEPMELPELSNGLTSCRKLEDEHGPKIDIVTVHDTGISGTTMDAISAATADRPIARTGEHIIIIYPSWYGICSHQHHEKPCRAYTSCLPCNNNYLVKGHIPTNDRTRTRANELHTAILNIVEQMVTIHSREIADDQETLTQHLCHLVERGLTPAQMTDELIARFHDIKHEIKDTVLKNTIHEAFVATGFVERLDDPTVTNGALMKYHNPTHHAAPGVERALDAYGGHEQIEQERLAMIEKYPQFAPTTQGLKDERSLSMPDDDYDECDDSKDATDE
ncbi:hypothetical protein Q7I37_03465 [Aeromonas allosaccharophila]|uniref:hypothetical protein n=1 Tax=Aeromonas allosaccharophila TaxID=656 RepID=UPI003005208C